MNRQLRAILFSNYGAAISNGLFSTIVALFVLELGGGALEVGMAAAAYLFFGGVFMLLLRPLIDKDVNRPKIYLAGYVVGGLNALFLLTVSSLELFYLAQLFGALATAMRVPAQRALYAEHQDKGKEGSEWSIMEGGDFIILGLAALASGLIVANISFDAVFALIALLHFGAAVMCIGLIRQNARR